MQAAGDGHVGGDVDRVLSLVCLDEDTGMPCTVSMVSCTPRLSVVHWRAFASLVVVLSVLASVVEMSDYGAGPSFYPSVGSPPRTLFSGLSLMGTPRRGGVF